MLTKMKNIQKFLFYTLVILGLFSCTTYRYEYTAPPTESGKTCAVQCMNTKNVCYSGAQAQAQNNMMYCQQQNNFNYQACVNRAQSHDDVKKCHPNSQYCSANPNYWNCDESYRQCFSACGGTVHIFKND
jgi:hypothetical protein